MYHLALSLYQHMTSREEYSLLLLGLDNAGKTTLLSAIKSLFPPPFASSNASLPPIAERTVPTVGQTVATVELPDMYLKIWDVGGQHSLRRLWKSYYRSAHAIVFVLDSADLGEGAEVERWEGLTGKKEDAGDHTEDDEDDDGTVRKVSQKDDDDDDADTNARADGERDLARLQECRLVLESILESADTAGVPVLVLANKQDREDCVETVRIKEGLVRPVFEGEKGHAVRDSRVLPISALKGTGVKEAVEWVRSRVKWNREARPPVMR